jgi:AcrR family transcriptional regulator
MKDLVQKQLAEARRNQILDAAAKVFAAKGFHPTTIRDIAREAGIGDGTIYNYFENKTALLLGIFDRMRDSIQPDPALLDFNTVDFRTFLKSYLRLPLTALFRVVVSEMMVNRELRDLYFQRILQPTLLMGEQLFRNWAARRAIPSNRVSLAVRTVSALVFGLMIEDILGDSVLEAHWDELPDFLADLFLDGLGSKNNPS